MPKQFATKSMMMRDRDEKRLWLQPVGNCVAIMVTRFLNPYSHTGVRGCRSALLTLGGVLLLTITLFSQITRTVLSEETPRARWRLTARPWRSLAIPRSAYLDAIEGVCRFTAKHQDQRGAVIDPFLKREHQYSTPYFAFAVGALVSTGRALDLLENGIRAMDHSTACFAQGREGIPDQHGEFFVPALTGALALYERHVPAEKLRLWRERMSVPLDSVITARTRINNWRTYPMKGEWLRVKAGLADRQSAMAFIMESWSSATQRERIAGDMWNLYQDHSSDPESHAVEAVGRGNLLALIAEGYDGELRQEIQQVVERGTLVSLLLQDPSGQCPPNGRTDDHVFNDVLYQLAFEVMAERALKSGAGELAGQYRRAAMLSFNSISRWRRTDGPWDGSYFVTKNHFDPAERVGYQQASNYGNYNGAVMLHLAEAYLARLTGIPEQPAPVEIGGYAFATDPKFASAVANAGGMQLFADLRGDTQLVFDHYWSALGVVRFGRVGWDTRLGPSDGVRDAKTGRGVSFAPTWMEEGKWVRLSDAPDRYRGEFSVEFAHPMLVRCAIEYRPFKDQIGPTFRHEFVLTPDGALATLRAPDGVTCGVTWPVLENDGAPLAVKLTPYIARTAYRQGADEQNFIALQAGAKLAADDTPLRSAYGWLRPVRVTTRQHINQTFIYPRGAGDPNAESVRRSFKLSPNGFSSILGRVTGNLYVGRAAAGGEGDSIDLNGDGKADVTFSEPCGFILSLDKGRVIVAEADRDVFVQIEGMRMRLSAHTPVAIER